MYAEDTQILKRSDIAACLPKRQANSHKGIYGHLLTICGSVGMAGAAILSARAALRSGVGLLTVALPQSIYPIVAVAVPEALFLPLPETESGTLSQAALPVLRRALTKKTALLIGCGLGINEDTEILVQQLLAEADCPIVLDADGLNIAARHIHILETAKVPLLLTPHPAEMARLCGKTVKSVQSDRVNTATAFAARYSVTIALKGYHTVVSDGTQSAINLTGNAGMATGGSGDVLAGMVASFVAQGMAPFDAMKSGVYLHGEAGDMAAKACSVRAMLPSDMIEQLKGVFLNLE